MISRLLVFACVVVWVAQVTTPGLTEDLALTQDAWREPQRFLTTMFTHSLFPVHLAVNMFALWIIGPQVEDAVGNLKFLVLYFASGLVGGLFYLGSGATIPAVGASGALFGLLGFALIYSQFQMQIVLISALNLFIGFAIPGIAWQAHLGGFIVGIGMALLWFTFKDWRKHLPSVSLPKVTAPRVRKPAGGSRSRPRIDGRY